MALWVGCERAYALLLESILEKRKEKEQRKDDTVKFKQALYYQLHEGLSLRPAHLQGITDAVSISNILGLKKEDFVAFHCVAERAYKKKFSKLFDFAAEDGATFDVIYEHKARFQIYLAQEEDLHVEQQDRTLSIDYLVVFKVYEGLLLLQESMLK